MSAHALQGMVQCLRRTVLLQEAAQWTDGQLLDCFLVKREAAALELLVQRHAGMVWGVCRRMLANRHDAEDAFQATFLVLVRKASSVKPRELVGNWLYGVACRTSLKARSTLSKRSKREKVVAEDPVCRTSAEDSELEALLDQELNQLSERFRAPLLLCDLQGKTRKQAAQLLNCPEGTVASRLVRARAMLAKRLRRHGVALSGAAATLLSKNIAAAAVPGAALQSTVKLACESAAGVPVSTLISPHVAALVDGVVKGMLLHKLHLVPVLLISFTLIMATTVYVGLSSASDPESDRTAETVEDFPRVHARPIEPPAPTRTDKAATTGRAARFSLPHRGQVWFATFSPDGKRLVTGEENRLAHVWSVSNTDVKRERTLAGLKSAPSCGTFSPDGKLIAIGSWDAVIALWDTDTGQLLARLSAPDSSSGMRSLLFTPDGKTLISSDNRNSIHFWDVAGRTVRKNVMGHHSSIMSAAICADGSTLVTGGKDRLVKLWDAVTMREKKVLATVDDEVWYVAIAPDASQVAAALNYRGLRVWDTATGRQRASFETPFIRGIAFSPDGNLLAAGVGREENVVKLWNTRDWTEQATLTGHRSWLFTVAFSPDGKLLASGGQDKVARIWHVPPISVRKSAEPPRADSSR